MTEHIHRFGNTWTNRQFKFENYWYASTC